MTTNLRIDHLASALPELLPPAPRASDQGFDAHFQRAAQTQLAPSPAAPAPRPAAADRAPEQTSSDSPTAGRDDRSPATQASPPHEPRRAAPRDETSEAVSSNTELAEPATERAAIGDEGAGAAIAVAVSVAPTQRSETPVQNPGDRGSETPVRAETQRAVRRRPGKLPADAAVSATERRRVPDKSATRSHARGATRPGQDQPATGDRPASASAAKQPVGEASVSGQDASRKTDPALAAQPPEPGDKVGEDLQGALARNEAAPADPVSTGATTDIAASFPRPEPDATAAGASQLAPEAPSHSDVHRTAASHIEQPGATSQAAAVETKVVTEGQLEESAGEEKTKEGARSARAPRGVTARVAGTVDKLEPPTVEAAPSAVQGSALAEAASPERAPGDTSVPSQARIDSAPTPPPAHVHPAASAPAPSPIASRAASGGTVGNAASGTSTRGLVEVDRVRLVQRVARAFEYAVEHGSPLRLRLSPPELGAVRVEIVVQGGKLRARLAAETVEAQNALLENAEALRERLADHNLQLEQFDVDLGEQSPQGRPEQSADERWQEAAPRQHEPGSGRERRRPARTEEVLPAATKGSAAGPNRLNVVI